jgi:cell division protein FtsW (lipid II flippase)
VSALPPRYGWGLLVPAAALSVVGVCAIQAAGSAGSAGLFTSDVIKQILFMLAGLVAMVAALTVGYQRIGRWSYLLFGLCIVMLFCLVLDRWVDLPFVPVRRNARRWIDLGPTQIQPSELMKITFVLALAWYLRYRRNYRTLGGLVMPFALTLVPMVLIKMQPDLGTVMLFLPVLFAMLFAAGARRRHLAIIIAMGIVCIPLFWFKIAPYQRLRIAGVVLQSEWLRSYLDEPPRYLEGRETRWDYLRPARADARDWHHQLAAWENNSGFQLVRSKLAVGSGGIYGTGWGHGLFVQHDFLPERHNDFIFALIAHQWGLIGGVLVMACYALMLLIGYDAAAATHDPYGRLVAVGLSTMIGVQALTSLCMTVGLGPITGVTLPFVSAGGSSLIASFLSVGLLISVARDRPVLMAKRPFEFDEEAEEYEAALR